MAIVDIFQGQQYHHLLFAVLGLLHLTREILLYFNFWQIKQYRWDRLKDGLKENYWILLPRSTVISGLILLSYFFLTEQLFSYLALTNLLIWDGYAAVKLLKKKWIYPIATKKSKVFLSGALVALILFKALALVHFPWYLPQITLLLVTFAPILSLVYLIMAEWPALLMKNRIINKARLHRNKFPGLKVIGITGSFGKTSVKDFLYHFLSYKYGSDKIVRTEGNVNTQLGIAQAVLSKINRETIFFICEMGAYRPNEIKRSSELIKPQIGILTGINSQHSSLFGSQKKIILAKYELIQSLPQTGLAVFNGDNRWSRLLADKFNNKIIISTKAQNNSDWLSSNVKIKKKSLDFTMIKGSEKIDFKTSLIGSQNIINIMMASVVALKLGLSIEEISKASLSLPFPAKSPYIFNYNGSDIIDATYSSNPDGALTHLHHLRLWSGYRAIIMNGFIELGPNTNKAYYQLGRAIGKYCHIAIFTDDHNLEFIKKGLASVEGKTEIIFTRNIDEIIEKINKFQKSEDVILLEGRLKKELMNSLKRS